MLLPLENKTISNWSIQNLIFWSICFGLEFLKFTKQFHSNFWSKQVLNSLSILACISFSHLYYVIVRAWCYWFFFFFSNFRISIFGWESTTRRILNSVGFIWIFAWIEYWIWNAMPKLDVRRIGWWKLGLTCYLFYEQSMEL